MAIYIGDELVTLGYLGDLPIRTLDTSQIFEGGVLIYTSGSFGIVASVDDVVFTSAPFPAPPGTDIWGCYGTVIGTSTSIGQAQSNMTAILSGCGTRPIFASVVDNLTLLGYSDWLLPTKDENQLIYDAMVAGTLPGKGTSGRFYASSSEGTVPANEYCALDYQDGSTVCYRDKRGAELNICRPIRYVTL